MNISGRCGIRDGPDEQVFSIHLGHKNSNWPITTISATTTIPSIVRGVIFLPRKTQQRHAVCYGTISMATSPYVMFNIKKLTAGTQN